MQIIFISHEFFCGLNWLQMKITLNYEKDMCVCERDIDSVCVCMCVFDGVSVCKSI